jgi:hypothetical protein
MRKPSSSRMCSASSTKPRVATSRRSCKSTCRQPRNRHLHGPAPIPSRMMHWTYRKTVVRRCRNRVAGRCSVLARGYSGSSLTHDIGK